MTSGFSEAAARSLGSFRASPTRRRAGWRRTSKQSASRVSAWSLMTRTRMPGRRVGVRRVDCFPSESDCWDAGVTPPSVGDDSGVDGSAPVSPFLLTPNSLASCPRFLRLTWLPRGTILSYRNHNSLFDGFQNRTEVGAPVLIFNQDRPVPSAGILYL